MSLKRFVACADSHGDIIDKEAAERFLEFVGDFKPHYRIHLGDVWDFRALRKGASQEEKADGIKIDFAMGLAFLDDYQPDYLTLGNHDKRVWEKAETVADGILREACAGVAERAEEEFRKRRINFTRYRVHDYLRLPEGGPKLIHGFRSTMYPAKAHFENWGDCIHGHVHKPDAYTARHVDGGRSFSVGCLGDIAAMSYADATPAKLAWRNGWLHGYINTKTGHWNAWLTTKENGTWWTP